MDVPTLVFRRKLDSGYDFGNLFCKVIPAFLKVSFAQGIRIRNSLLQTVHRVVVGKGEGL